MTDSAVDFPTSTRFHMGLTVRDIGAARTFYERLLDMKPTKVRHKYVKFESHEPPLNLTLNEGDGDHVARGPASHFGIQVKSTAAVAHEEARLHALGLSTRTEDEVTCCYAVQDKVWVRDPDGNDWEIFVVTTADAPPERNTHSDDACCASDSRTPCC